MTTAVERARADVEAQRDRLEAFELHLQTVTLEALQLGVSITEAARQAGVNRSTIYRWQGVSGHERTTA